HIHVSHPSKEYRRGRNTLHGPARFASACHLTSARGGARVHGRPATITTPFDTRPPAIRANRVSICQPRTCSPSAPSAPASVCPFFYRGCHCPSGSLTCICIYIGTKTARPCLPRGKTLATVAWHVTQTLGTSRRTSAGRFWIAPESP